MFELFKSEIWRLKIWIVIPAILYLLLNSASIYFGEYIDSGRMIGTVHTVVFAISSLLLGLFQFHAYKKPSRWIYLINRPASFIGLCLILLAAGALIILLQFVIPDLMLTLTMDSLTPYLIEIRHYYQAIYVLFISLAFYLSGVYIQLSPSKGGFLVLVLPIIAVNSLLKSGPVLIISALIMLWLLLLVISVFNANIHSKKTSLFAKVLAIIPFQLGLYFIILTVLAFTFQLRLMLIDGAGIDVPWNNYFDNDVYKHVEYLDGREQIILNLENAEADIKEKYNNQLQNIETHTSMSRFKFFSPTLLLPYQQNINLLNIVDSANDVNWVFSFDQMSFVNTNNANHAMFNSNGEIQMFKTVPNVINNFSGVQVVTENEIYSYDSDFQQLNLRFKTKQDESFISGFNFSNATVNILTTKHLYIFDSEKVKLISKMLTPHAVVNLPGAIENLTSIDTAEMMDTTLIGLLYGKLSDIGHHKAYQVLLEIDSDQNQIEKIAHRPLKQGMSEMYNKMNWYISPLTHLVYEYGVKPLISAVTLKPVRVVSDLQFSVTLTILVITLILISVFAFLWIVRKRNVTKFEMVTWLIITCLTSITGFLTFLLLTDKKSNINHQL